MPQHEIGNGEVHPWLVDQWLKSLGAFAMYLENLFIRFHIEGKEH